jgi:transposase InsO family protein
VSAFIDSQKAAGFALELCCRTLGVSRSAYYQRASARRWARVVADEQLIAVIKQLHKDNFEAYGYRKLHLALRRHGVEVGRDRVKRLMRAHSIQGAKRRGTRWQTTTPHPHASRRADLVGRDFSASGPDELYVADFTYLRCWERLVFLAFVIDVYSRRVVGWQLTSHMRASLVCDALRMAVSTRPRGADVALVHHSDPRIDPIHQFRVRPAARRSRRPAVRRLGWRRLRRPRRELRRHDQDRTDRRPRLTDPLPARAGDRRVPRRVNTGRLHESLGDTPPPSSVVNTHCAARLIISRLNQAAASRAIPGCRCRSGSSMKYT